MTGSTTTIEATELITDTSSAERRVAPSPLLDELMVRSSEGRSLPGSLAFAHLSAASVTEDAILWELRSDERGLLYLPSAHHLADDVRLTVACAGFLPETTSLATARSTETIVLQPAATLHIRLVDLYGIAMPDVLLGVSNGRGILTATPVRQTGAENSVAAARTKESGVIVFSGIRPNTEHQLHMLDPRFVIVRGETTLPALSPGEQREQLLEVGVLLVALVRTSPDRPHFMRVMPSDALQTSDVVMSRVIRQVLDVQRQFPDCHPVSAIARNGLTLQTNVEIGLGDVSDQVAVRAVVSASCLASALVPQDVIYRRPEGDLATIRLVVADPTGYAVPQQRLMLQPVDKTGRPVSLVSNRPQQLRPGRYLIRGSLDPELEPTSDLPKDITLAPYEDRTLTVSIKASLRPVLVCWEPPNAVATGANTEISWGPDANHMKTLRSINPASATILMPTGWLDISIKSSGRSWSGRVEVKCGPEDETQTVNAVLQ